MDSTGIPSLAELYRGLTIDTRSKIANRHLRLAFKNRRVWLQLNELKLGKRRTKKKKCTKRDHESCTRNECRNGYELTKIDVVDVLSVNVGMKSVGNSEKGFRADMIDNVPAFNRFVNVINDRHGL